MSLETEPEAPFPHVPCPTILWRALRGNGPKYFNKETQSVARGAFFRRPDEYGLSIGLKGTCTCAEYIESADLSNIKKVATLHTGRVREQDFQVEQNAPFHGEIVGMPVYRDPAIEGDVTDEEIDLVENRADDLVGISRVSTVAEIDGQA